MARSTTHSVPWSDDPDHIADHHVSDEEFQALMKIFDRKRRLRQQQQLPVVPPEQGRDVGGYT